MSVPELAPRQVAINDLVLGQGTDYIVSAIVAGGLPELRTNDRELPRADGVAFGRDRRSGRTLTFEFTVDKADFAGAAAAWSALSRAWSGDYVRGVPGEVTELTLRWHDGPSRVVYGRPRKLDPANEKLLMLGRVDSVADFAAVDHVFYSATEYVNSLSIVPPSAGGLTAPLAAPLTTVAQSAKPGVITVDGDMPAWLVIEITGPISQPVVDVVGHYTLGLNLTLGTGERVIIDPRPWRRSVRRNGTANVSGALTSTSPRLSAVVAPLGANEVVLRGTDATGTAALTVRWRSAFATP